MKKVFVFLITIIIVSCSANDEPIKDNIDQKLVNEILIQRYLEKNNYQAKKSESGFYYVIHNQGTGKTPTISSNITVSFKSHLLDGKVFDEGTKAHYIVSELSPSFKEGMQYINEGGKITLILSSRLDFKNSKIENIPAGTVVVFDITLHSTN